MHTKYWNMIDFPHHAFHLPGAAGTIPHQTRIIYFFVCHLGFVTVLVVQIMALLALNQLVPHGHCHLSWAKTQQSQHVNGNACWVVIQVYL